jgi:hypothetical protein
MLRILGSPKKLCNQMTRRDMLWAGGLSLFGLGLTDLYRASAAPRSDPVGRSFGKAKSCILLYLYGSPSQLETFDMKPDAPDEVRGEMKPIRSATPGCDVCEYLPQTAKVMDKVTVVRSLTHPYPIHGVAYATTGISQIDLAMELNPHDSRHWPFIGSVVDYVGQQSARPQAERRVPDNIALPFPFSSQRVGEVPRAGPYAAFLGGAYNPIYTQFHGTPTRTVYKTVNNVLKGDVSDPYMGITRDCSFELAGAGQLPADVTLDRLDTRRGLLDQLELARRDLEGTPAGQSNDRFRQMALSLMRSEKMRTALDVSREPDRLRESYGWTLFGQSALTARRLIEAGSRFVSVFWDEYGLAGTGWDTHVNHYTRMKDELLPGFDRAFASLIQDLETRGLLDETLVVVLSEHGRTPKLSKADGGGRDHWSQAYSAAFAGGGVARGSVIGKTDKIGGTVADRPISPKDVLATVYHLLGIDRETLLRDRTGRPMPLVADGVVVPEMLA